MANTIGNLLVSTQELLSASSQLSGHLTTMQTCFDAVKKAVDRTRTYWIGEAGNAHRSLYQQQVERTEEILRRYREHVTDLNAMAGVYEQAEQTATSAAEELPSISF